MTAWQPIETAPRDGTEILVYVDVATVPIVHVARWVEPEEWADPGSNETAGWWSYTENSVSQSNLVGFKYPTHWMHFYLPEPPK